MVKWKVTAYNEMVKGNCSKTDARYFYYAITEGRINVDNINMINTKHLQVYV